MEKKEMADLNGQICDEKDLSPETLEKWMQDLLEEQDDRTYREDESEQSVAAAEGFWVDEDGHWRELGEIDLW